MRWAWYVGLIKETKNTHTILVGNLKGRDHLGELGVNGMTN
jgi:hypothetical protein